jgi:hypothetical protein
MAWYNTGTIALTNGSATVTGSGTNFLVGAQIGEALYAPDGKLYEIQTINSATVITLASNYLGSTASTQGYQIIPTQSLVADLASDVTDLISDFADVRDYAGNGKFNDGAVGTPGITFTQDQDNGLYRIGSNNWALAAGGIKQVDLSATDVEINYAGVKKLATTATGIDVTGTVTADGLTVSGSTTSAFSSGSENVVATFTSTDTEAQINLVDTTGSAQIRSRNDFRFYVNGGTPLRAMDIASNGDISFYEDTGTTPKLFWDASAERLGIGTASPVRVLDIATTTGGTIIHLTDDATGHTATDGVDLQQEGTLFQIINREAGDIRFGTSNVERMRIDSSGKVGIGTSSPSSYWANADDLVVATSGNTGISVVSGTTNLGYLIFADSTVPGDTTRGGLGYDHSTNNMFFRVNNAEAMRLDASGQRGGGNVGIGTSSPDTLLHLSDTAGGAVIRLERNDTTIASTDVYGEIHRFKDLYRSGSTISTSDRNMKQDERDLTVAEATVAQACKSLLKAFRFIDAVEKDGDGARIHFGIVAQDLQAAFEAEGLDATDYAMFRPSTYTDENGNEQTRLGVCYENLLAFIIAAI